MKIPPYLYISLALLWLYSGVVPLMFNQSLSLDLLAQMGFVSTLAWILLIGASVIDVAYGIAILSPLKRHAGLWLVQCITIALYSVLIMMLLPAEHLMHPFAPVLKNIPILALCWYLYRYHSTVCRQGQ